MAYDAQEPVYIKYLDISSKGVNTPPEFRIKIHDKTYIIKRGGKSNTYMTYEQAKQSIVKSGRWTSFTEIFAGDNKAGKEVLDFIKSSGCEPNTLFSIVRMIPQDEIKK